MVTLIDGICKQVIKYFKKWRSNYRNIFQHLGNFSEPKIKDLLEEMIRFRNLSFETFYITLHQLLFIGYDFKEKIYAKISNWLVQ